MTVASITTDINIGPFKIPSNAQNMIMNNYADRKDLKIEVLIPEPIFSNQLATTKWLLNSFKFKHIILCSIHQMPKNKKKLNDMIKYMKKIKFHFVIEGINGSGEKFLKNCYKEAKIFQNMKIEEARNKSWLELYKKFSSQK